MLRGRAWEPWGRSPATAQLKNCRRAHDTPGSSATQVQTKHARTPHTHLLQVLRRVHPQQLGVGRAPRRQLPAPLQQPLLLQRRVHLHDALRLLVVRRVLCRGDGGGGTGTAQRDQRPRSRRAMPAIPRGRLLRCMHLGPCAAPCFGRTVCPRARPLAAAPSAGAAHAGVAGAVLTRRGAA